MNPAKQLHIRGGKSTLIFSINDQHDDNLFVKKHQRDTLQIHWLKFHSSEDNMNAAVTFFDGRNDERRTTNPNGGRVDISRESDILKRRLLGYFHEARGVSSEIQFDRSEEEVDNTWSLSLHVEKRHRPTVTNDGLLDKILSHFRDV
ncbi:hypothetical protein GQ457_10G016550 [Hibiscus cannabinus]